MRPFIVSYPRKAPIVGSLFWPIISVLANNRNDMMEDEKQNSQSPVSPDEIQTGLMHKYKKKYKKGGRYCIVKQKQTSYDKLTADLEIPTK